MAQKTIKANAQLPITQTVSALVDEIKDLTAQRKEIEAKLDVYKAKLKTWVKKEYFKHNEDALIVEQVFDLIGRRSVVQVDFVNKYHLNEERFLELQGLLGGALASLHFGTESSIVVGPIDKLSAARSKVLKWELSRLATKFNLATAEQTTYVVNDEFHDERHVDFDPALNMKIDKILPVEVQVTI